MSGLHPWVWDAARTFWAQGAYRVAVREAASSLNAHTQAKVGRYDVADHALLGEVFSASARQERARLRRDLHDGLGPSLAGVALGLKAVEVMLQADPERTGQLLLRLCRPGPVNDGTARGDAWRCPRGRRGDGRRHPGRCDPAGRTAMSNVRVVVADDHPMFRCGLVAALATAPDVKVVGEAVDGLELLTVVQREAPDVVLTDLTMPGLNDCWPTSPVLRVVVLTMHEDDEAVFQAMPAGAHGFLVKGADVQDILRAVLAVAAGERSTVPLALSSHVALIDGRASWH